MYKYLSNLIEKTLKVYKTVWVHSNLSQGGETIWGFTALTLKKKYPDKVKLFAEVPFNNQAQNWTNPIDVKNWQKLFSQADDKIIYSDSYQKNAYPASAMGMIDHCDVLLAIWDKKPSNVTNLVYYAKMKNKILRIIDPSQFEPEEKPKAKQLIYD